MTDNNTAKKQCNCRYPGSLGGDCDGSCTHPPPICPVCLEEIESDDGTEEGGQVYHYVCLGNVDE